MTHSYGAGVRTSICMSATRGYTDSYSCRPCAYARLSHTLLKKRLQTRGVLQSTAVPSALSPPPSCSLFDLTAVRGYSHKYPGSIFRFFSPLALLTYNNSSHLLPSFLLPQVFRSKVSIQCRAPSSLSLTVRLFAYIFVARWVQPFHPLVDSRRNFAIHVKRSQLDRPVTKTTDS